MERHEKIHESYMLLCRLIKLFLEKGLRLVVENPATTPHYLTTYFLPCTFVDKDRRIDGDYYRKPTQYWFFGFEPKRNLVFEPLEHVDNLIINNVTSTTLKMNRQTARSLIHPQYARRFIKRYILEENEQC